MEAQAASAGRSEPQGDHQDAGCNSSSSSKKATKTQMILGGLTLALAGTVLLLILLPSIIPLMLAWCVVELLWWMLAFSPEQKQLDQQPEEGHWPLAAAQYDMTAFKRFLKYCQEAPGRVDYKKYLTGWFLGADIDGIKRDNIEEFVAYGFLFKTREELAAEGQADLPKRMTDQLEQVWDIECPPGFNPDIKFMGHLREPLCQASCLFNESYRPLLFYLFVELIAYCSRQYLDYKGFEHHRHAGLNYFTLDIQPPTKALPSKQGNSKHAQAAAVAAASAAAATQQGSSGSAGTPAASMSTSSTLAPSAGAAAAAAAAAGAANSLESSLQQQPQQQLQPILEHHFSGPHGSLGQGEQLSSGSSARPATSTRHSSDVSELSTSDMDLYDSPFAISAASPEVAAAVAAGVISEVEASSAAAGAAPRERSDSSAGSGAAKKTRSLPASAAAAEAAKAEARQPPQLRQRASCSVLQRRLSGRGSMAPPNSRVKPLQAALSQALTDAGVLEAGVPVVFLHGIGGLPAYLELLNYLEAEGSPLLAVEVKSVAMRLGPVYPVSDVAKAVIGMMDKMGVNNACFVAHSYGTFIASYIAKQHPKRMRGCVLIDPVCLGMFMPNLIFNFLYKTPVWQGWGKAQLSTYIKAKVRRFVSTELHVRASVARRFYWTELCAWPEDLPAGSTIILSGQDDLMDSPEVEVMFKNAPHIKVRYNEMLTHGAFLLNKEVKQAIRAELQALLATSGSAVVGLARQLSTLVHPAAAAGAGLPNKASTAVQHALRQVQSWRPVMGSAGSSSGGVAGAVGCSKQAGGSAAGAGEVDAGAAADQGRGRQKQQPVARSYSDGSKVLLDEHKAVAGAYGAGVLGEQSLIGVAAQAAGSRKAAEVEPAGDAECDVAAAGAGDQR